MTTRLRTTPIAILLCAALSGGCDPSADSTFGDGGGDGAPSSDGARGDLARPDGAPGDLATALDAAAPSDGAPPNGVSGASQATCGAMPCTPGPAPGSFDFQLANVDDGDGNKYTRYYSVYRPSGLANAATNQVPAVLVFSGAGGCGSNEAIGEFHDSRLGPIADANRFIVVFMLKRTVPNCLTTWRHPGVDADKVWPPNSPSDEPYVTAVLDDLLVKQNVDPARIYAMGTSAGGGMVVDIACDPVNSPRMRGVSINSSTVSVVNVNGVPTGMPHCASKNQNLFVQQIVGDSGIDANIIQGNCAGACLYTPSQAADFWRQRLGCPATKQTSTYGMPNALNQRERYVGACAFAQNYAVEDIVVVHGSHTWTCHDSGGPNLLGCSGAIPDTNGEWDGQEMWDFFANGVSHP